MNRLKTLAFGLVTSLSLSMAVTVKAETLTFDSMQASSNFSGTPDNPSSVINNNLSQYGIVFGRSGKSNGVAVIDNWFLSTSPTNFISGLDTNGELTENVSGDMYFYFVNPFNTAALAVTDFVSFQIGDNDDSADTWTIHAYDLNDHILNTQLLVADNFINYSLPMAGIHRIWIENTTGSIYGFGVDDLTFHTPVTTTAVPEPVSLATLSLMLSLIAYKYRRKIIFKYKPFIMA